MALKELKVRLVFELFLLVHFIAVVRFLTGLRMRSSGLRSWTSCWAPRAVRRPWTWCVTSTTPRPTWACVSSPTLTLTGSACIYSSIYRQAKNPSDIRIKGSALMIPKDHSLSFMIIVVYAFVRLIQINHSCLFVKLLKWKSYSVFQHHMSDVPVRYIHFDLPCREAYSLDSLGKHGFGERANCSVSFIHSCFPWRRA